MINEFKYVKREQFDHLHLVYHFTVPLIYGLLCLYLIPHLLTTY